MPDSRPTVLQVTWNWREPVSDQAQPNTNLRRAAIVQALVTGTVAVILYFGLGHQLAGRIIAGLATVVLLLGLFIPAAYAVIHRFGQTLGRATGSLLTHLLLTPFFYLFFLPVALWLRFRGRDPLHRTFRDPRWTYWVSRQPQPRDQNIERQFLLEDRAARGQLREVGSLPERTPEDQS